MRATIVVLQQVCTPELQPAWDAWDEVLITTLILGVTYERMLRTHKGVFILTGNEARD